MEVVKKEKQIREVDVIIQSYNLCDKCDKKIENDDNFDAFECEFIHKTGNIYPGAGFGVTQKMELCKKCAKELIETLRLNGYRITESNWDF